MRPKRQTKPFGQVRWWKEVRYWGKIDQKNKSWRQKVLCPCLRRLISHLSDGVTTIDAEVGASDIVGGIGQQESHGAHEILGRAHLSLGYERGPLLLEVWVVVKDLLGAVKKVVHQSQRHCFPERCCHVGLAYTCMYTCTLCVGDLQGCEHVSGRDAVDTDADMSPLDSQGRGHVADSGLGRVVRPIVAQRGQL